MGDNQQWRLVDLCIRVNAIETSRKTTIFHVTSEIGQHTNLFTSID
jgi:hypothetical protein